MSDETPAAAEEARAGDAGKLPEGNGQPSQLENVAAEDKPSDSPSSKSRNRRSVGGDSQGGRSTPQLERDGSLGDNKTVKKLQKKQKSVDSNSGGKPAQTKKPQSFKRSSSKSIDSKSSLRKKELPREPPIAEPVEDPELRAAKARQLVVERRLLFFATGSIGVAAVLWLISICTEYWFVVTAPTPDGLYMANYTRYFLYSKSGLFTICRYARKNDSVITLCRRHEMFPSAESYDDKTLDKEIINYTRTELFFSVVSLVFMIMGFMFSIYTFRNPRYMFKRLAAGIHFLSASAVIVVVEVVIHSIEYEREKLPYVHPPGAEYYYHFSFYLAWTVFLINGAVSIVFLMYSKKRKRDKALTEEMALADEPTIIGR